MDFKMNLSYEEQLAYEFALHWRDENFRPELQAIDWMRFATILTHNRMAMLASAANTLPIETDNFHPSSRICAQVCGW